MKDFIESELKAADVEAYWFPPSPGDKTTTFGVKSKHVGNGSCWYLETLKIEAPAGPEDKKTIKCLLLALWKKGGKKYWKGRFTSGWVDEKIFVTGVIELGKLYGLNLKL